MTRFDMALPSWRKMLREGPSIARLIVAQFRRQPLRARPIATAPVMVLPAFMCGDFHTRLLRRTIAACGGRAFGWDQGMNLGMDPAKFARLLARTDALVDKAGERLVLVGWSLGGLYARELARRRPEKVSMVVTLGTPFSHGPGRNNAKPIYDLINDHDADHPPIARHPGEKPPVLTVACWSGREGIVAPISAAGEDGEADERVQLDCAHHDMVTDPEALRTIVAILRAERALRLMGFAGYGRGRLRGA
jgi:pimeloyl-ACP methyl ester carboxylesterase